LKRKREGSKSDVSVISDVEVLGRTRLTRKDHHDKIDELVKTMNDIKVLMISQQTNIERLWDRIAELEAK
jgi:hypothetical protein